MPEKEIKIVTYNIHKGFSSANFRFVLHQICDELKAVDPDIVFLQEIQGEHSKRAERIEDWPQKPQAEFLAENCWPYYAYGKNALHKYGHHGNAILSKFPILNWENISLAKYKHASRSLLHATLDIGDGQKMHVICIHFALFKTQRKKQLTKLKNRILEHVPIDAPLIIAGDFNDWRGQAESYLETELEMREAFKVIQGFHARTFPAWRPRLAVDRIYFRNLNLVTCQRLGGLPWSKLSDHIPLFATFAANV